MKPDWKRGMPNYRKLDDGELLDNWSCSIVSGLDGLDEDLKMKLLGS